MSQMPPVPSMTLQPQTIRVVTRHGGFLRAVIFVSALFLFGAVFLLGMVLGGGAVMTANAGTGAWSTTWRSGSFTETVAILPIKGVIDAGQSAHVHQAVDAILEDSTVQAVVLRVDSPGGGVTASDQIWHEVGRLQRAGLPVVASYGAVAASGGYYVSCGADHIMAEQTTITGSIGVIAQIMTIEGLLEKVGVQDSLARHYM